MKRLLVLGVALMCVLGLTLNSQAFDVYWTDWDEVHEAENAEITLKIDGEGTNVRRFSGKLPSGNGANFVQATSSEFSSITTQTLQGGDVYVSCSTGLGNGVSVAYLTVKYYCTDRGAYYATMYDTRVNLQSYTPGDPSDLEGLLVIWEVTNLVRPMSTSDWNGGDWNTDQGIWSSHNFSMQTVQTEDDDVAMASIVWDPYPADPDEDYAGVTFSYGDFYSITLRIDGSTAQARLGEFYEVKNAQGQTVIYSTDESTILEKFIDLYDIMLGWVDPGFDDNMDLKDEDIWDAMKSEYADFKAE